MHLIHKMSYKDNSSDKNLSSISDEIAIPPLVCFWIFLPFYIPSVICSLFVLYHYISDRILRQALHNHVIIIILFINLIVQLTGIAWNLNYYRLGYVWPQSPYLCIVWIVIDEGFHIAITIFFAWAAIERHILIFHDRLVANKKKIIRYHYLPIIILFLYCFCYNIIVIIFPPCENIYDYTQIVCGYPLCYYDDRLLAIWAIIVNHIIPIIIIVSCSIGLLLRIFYQKRRMRRPIRWRNYRKMTIQLLSISFMYLVLHTPHILMEFLHLWGISGEFSNEFMAYTEFFEYYSNLVLPFVCAGSIPELQKKLKKIFPYWGRQMRAVHPQIITLQRRVGDQQRRRLSLVQ